MITLKEIEAIDYLERARSIIKPEHDRVSHLSMLATMLEIEKVYLQRMAGLENINVLAVNSTGFPELGSWLVDIKKAFEEFAIIKAKRAKAILPLLDQISNVSYTGMLEETHRFANNLAADQQLSAVLSKFTPDQKRLLTPDPVNTPGFPFSLDPAIPGALMTTNSESAFQNHTLGWLELEGGVRLAGVKYIDSTNQNQTNKIAREPTIIYALFGNGQRIEKIVLLTASTPLSQRIREKITPCYSCSECRRQGYSAKHRGFEWYTDIQNTEITFETTETDFREINHPFKQSLIQADLTGLDETSKYHFFKQLIKLDQASKTMVALYTQSLKGEVVTAEEFSNQNNKAAQQIDEVFKTLPSDQLRTVLQLALAEIMSQFRINANKGINASSEATTTNQSPAIMQKGSSFLAGLRRILRLYF